MSGLFQEPSHYENPILTFSASEVPDALYTFFTLYILESGLPGPEV